MPEHPASIMVCLIIPALNEAEVIAEVVRSVSPDRREPDHSR